jgi:hypothetical protein
MHACLLLESHPQRPRSVCQALHHLQYDDYSQPVLIVIAPATELLLLDDDSNSFRRVECLSTGQSSSTQCDAVLSKFPQARRVDDHHLETACLAFARWGWRSGPSFGLRPSLSYPNLLVRDDVWKRTKLSHRSLRQPYTNHRLWIFNPNWILNHSEYIMHTPYAGLSVICGDGWTVVGRWSSTLPRFNVLLAPALITDWKLRTPRDPIWKCITTGCDSSR